MSNPGGVAPPLEFAGNSVWSVWVYLARHGRTALNVGGALRGHIDVPLDDVGHRQAEALGRALAPRKPRLVVSSPLSRATQTAEAIAKACGIDVVADPRLTDRYYGAWAGMRTADVARQWGSLDAAPEVEPADEVCARAMAALHDIVARSVGGSVVVVAHDVVNRLLLSSLNPSLGEAGQLPQETGCFNTIEFRKEGLLPLSCQVAAVNEVPEEAPASAR